jgi:hypothetical protein
VFAEHQVIADIERTATEESACIGVSTASAGLLARHVTGELRDVQTFSRNAHQERVLLSNGESLKGVHYVAVEATEVSQAATIVSRSNSHCVHD